MTSSSKKDPNRGPLKLDHDSSPRDLTKFNASVDGLGLEENYRYRGYPAGQFETHHTPAKAVCVEDPSKHFPLPSILDPNNHKLSGNPTGLQYGSDSVPTSEQRARQIRDPFNEKTSAELRKHQKHLKEAEEDILNYRAERIQKLHDERKQKRKDLDQLRSYYPWGRPGAGAPNKMDSSYAELYSKRKSQESKKPDVQISDSYYKNYGRPGGGAPLRTESGNVKAGLPGSPSLRFQDSEKGRVVFDKEVRYRKNDEEKSTYSKELNGQIYEKSLEQQEQRIADLKNELEMLRHDPYGKPGGGAPNKGANGEKLTKRRLLLTPGIKLTEERAHHGSPEVNKSKSSDQAYFDPWGKGACQPIRDKYGEIRRFRNADPNHGVYTEPSPRLPASEDSPRLSLEMNSDRGGGGAPKLTDSGTPYTRNPITLRRNETGATTVIERQASERRMDARDASHHYYPFGHFSRGGAGAPVRDEKGNIKTKVYGAIYANDSAATTPREEAKQIYLRELKREIQEQKTKKEEEKILLKHGAGELTSKILEGQVGKPRRDPHTGILLDQHLPSTDVTQEQTNTRSMKNENSPAYHTELEKAAEERKRIQELDRLRDNQQSKQHQVQMQNYWGKPGYGAPQSSNLRKGNLDQLLYTSNQNKLSVPSKSPYSEFKSTHTNMYELDLPLRSSEKQTLHQSNPPWAIEAEAAS